MTYDELLQQISAAGQNWSQWDLETAKNNPAFGASLFTYKNDYAAATDAAGKQAANQGAEALRRQYGSYLGGSDGSKYYGLGGPASYQTQQWQGSEAGSGISDILKQMQNYGSFSYDTPKPEYTNQYQQAIQDLLGQTQNYGPFSYGPAPEYQNQYQQAISSLLGQVQDYGPFSWDKDTDPAYSAYAKQYRREGDRATANALAQAAAATGGQVSTAAMTAASQAGDYYAGQLADKIPELYENAYQRYLSDYKLLADKLNQTQQEEQRDYSKYQDQLGQYNTDRNFAYSDYLNQYNMMTDKLGQLQQAEQYDYAKYLNDLNQFNTDRNLAYNEFNSGFDRLGAVLGGLQGQDDREYNRFLQQDQTGYERWLDQINFNQNQDALTREQLAADQSLYQKQVDAILSAGGTPSADMIAKSGYSSEYANALANYYRQQMAGKSSGGSSGGGRRSSGGSSSSGGTGDSGNIYQKMYDSGVRSESDAYAMLLSMGYNTTQAGKLAKYFNDFLGSAESGQGQSGSVTVDMNSVLQLGYGPINDAELDRLVSSGVVEEYQEGNKIKFRKTGKTSQTSQVEDLLKPVWQTSLPIEEYKDSDGKTKLRVKK